MLVSRCSLLLAGVLLLCACGTTTSSTDRPAPRPDRNLISQAEIEASAKDNAYDLVHYLRPLWLRKRGHDGFTTPGDVVVYMDYMRLGGPEALRQIHLVEISTIRWFDASEATRQWGRGHGYGAILVSTALGAQR